MKNAKRYYAAVNYSENNKYYAYIIPFTGNDNILNKITRPGIITANIYSSKKAAAELVTEWNQQYNINGTNLF